MNGIKMWIDKQLRRLNVPLSVKNNFRPNLVQKCPNCGPKFFFDSWYHLNLLDNIVVYHDMQNEKRLTTNNGENEFGDKNDLETSLNWALIWPENFFQQQNHNCLLDIMTASWIMQNQRNLMIQTWIIDQKPQIWANLGHIFPNLGQIIFFWKSGLVTFFDLANLMQKIKEILWLVSEESW